MTAVLLLSSSEARLPPPCLLLMLRRLELRFGRIMALMGRGTAMLGGDAGGEIAAMVWAATAAPYGGKGGCAQSQIDAPNRRVAGCSGLLLAERRGLGALGGRGGLHQRVRVAARVRFSLCRARAKHARRDSSNWLVQSPGCARTSDKNGEGRGE